MKIKNKFVINEEANLRIVGIFLITITHPGLVHSEILKNDSESISPQYKKSVTFNGWTAERLKNAQPKLMQIKPELNSNVFGHLEKKSAEFFDTFKGKLPDESRGKSGQTPNPNQESKPNDNHQAQVFEAPMIVARKAEIVKGNAGTRVAPYTSSELIPRSARVYYPYRTVGKLFFSDEGDDQVCSAAVISPRLIVTAGHCLHSGNDDSSGWYSDFLFIPAFENGDAPFSTWTWSHVWVNPDWFSGGGDFPNAGDVGLLVLEDQTLSAEDRSTRIGDQVGWLGWQTHALSHNHVHMLGYPNNFDRGLKMHQVTSQAYQTRGGGLVVEYGSDMEDGSSGGPWIENLGTDSRVVGVTSYGYPDPAINLQGSSGLNNDFVDGLDQLCALENRNCN